MVKGAMTIVDKLLVAIISIAILSAFAPTVVVFLANLTDAMSTTTLAALFSANFLTLLFGIFALVIVIAMFVKKGK